MALPTTADEVWQQIEKWPFAVLSFVTPEGESRSAGVMYVVRGRVLNVVTGPETWKARHMRNNPHVSVTVTVPRLPVTLRKIPPAVITFPGYATVVAYDEIDEGLRTDLLKDVGDELGEMCVIQVVPEGHFVTYGIGVFPMKMRHPDQALARVAV